MTMLPSETFWHQGKRWERLPERPYEHWVMGLDLGQRVDHSAISAIQHVREPLDDWGCDGFPWVWITPRKPSACVRCCLPRQSMAGPIW